ncbi:hypothetical protein [Mycoplasma leonicaptivi]|uniref:hypothetical protein n=1 Tax=Mycoplasma leonicaptivi TaxID=36742 RepID=UPI000686AA2C|nr:hypothetical protein [Mycoplasma leonicaptivi]
MEIHIQFSKKRIQLKKWYKDFINDYSSLNSKIYIFGIYRYKNNILFCDFKIKDYINNKLNSSSAHVYINDLYQALKYNIFNKIDLKNNHINVFKKEFLLDYLNDSKNNDSFSFFTQFNKTFKFNKQLIAIDCIKEMKENNWYQAKGVEWVGWFLEFKFNQFINDNNLKEFILMKDFKDKFKLDFDLFFTKDNFYGDLKCSDLTKKQAIGNDQKNTLKAIEKYNKLWYIIYEHTTLKDKDFNNEMAKARMELFNIKDNKISYANKMKHSVIFKKMRIFEINQNNFKYILSDFKQRHNSGKNKNPRNLKFLLNKDNMNNSIIYTYTKED